MARKKLTAAQLESIRIIETGQITATKKLFYDFNSGQYIYQSNNKLQYFEKEQARKKLFEVFKLYELSSIMIDRLPSYSVEFDPKNDETFYERNDDKYFNSFIASKYFLEGDRRERVVGNDLSFVEKYPYFSMLLKNLFVKDEYLHYFINWLSFIVNTREKARTTILLKGLQGIGKNTLYEKLLAPIFSEEYCYIAENDSISSRFNEGFRDKLFILFNEIKGNYKENSTLAEKLKMYITDPTITVELKGVNRYHIKNNFNCMFFSNDALPVQISPDDRRYSVFNTSSKTLLDICNELGISTSNFYDQLDNERDAFISDLIKFKWSRDLATKVLKTEEKEVVAESTTTKIELVSAKIQKQDCDWLWSRGVEYLDMKKDMSHILSDAEYLIDIQHLEKFVREVSCGRITNSSLTNMYKLFINDSETSAQKIGNSWSNYLGKSKIGSNERYRLLPKKVQWDRPVDVLDDEVNDPFIKDVNPLDIDKLDKVVETIINAPVQGEVGVNYREYSEDFSNDTSVPFANIILEFKTDIYVVNYKNGESVQKKYSSLTSIEKEHAPTYF